MRAYASVSFNETGRLGNQQYLTGTRGRLRTRKPLLKKKGEADTHDQPQPTALKPGAPSDLELMEGIQREESEALSQLYDRYNGILKALVLRVIHNEAEADDLLQEIFMEIWNQEIGR